MTMELLFWKVWRNVYLNYVVFTVGTSNVEHIDYRKIYAGNKIKCKDIHSLKWMVDNGQLELLKYKLESGEYIEYSSTGFNYLVKSINTTNYQLGVDIFRLLEKRKSEYYNEDFLQIALIYKRELVVELLLSEKQGREGEGLSRIYNGNIDAHFIPSLHRKNFKIIELISNCIPLNKRNGPFNYIKGTYIDRTSYGSYGLANYEYLKKLVSRFPQYFDIEDIQCNGGNIKSVPYLLKQLELNSYIEELKCEIISKCPSKEFDKMVTCLIGEIKSKQNQQHQSMKLKHLQPPFEYSYDGLVYLKVYQKCISTSDDSTQSQKDQLELIQSQINEITNSNKDQFEIDKEFMKLFICTVNSCYLYTLYYYKYFETVDHLQFKHTRNFKELVPISEIMKLITAGSGNTLDEILRIVKIVSGSIKNTTKNKHIYRCIILKVVQLVINCIGSNEEYEMVIKSIDGNNIFDLPLKWNKEFKQLFNCDINTIYTITNMELIDWLSTDINKNLRTILYYSKRINGTIEFGSLELIKYTMLKLEPTNPNFTNKFKPIQIPPIKWSEILNNPFNNLVNQNEFITTNINEMLTLFKSHLIQDYQFKPILIQYIVNQHIGSGSMVEYSNLDKSITNGLLSSLLKSILEYDLRSTGFILSILNFKSFENEFLKIWQGLDLVKQELLYTYGNICTTNTNSDTVIEYIRFWLLNKHFTTTEIFGYICNYLYKKLIQIQGISIELVEMIKNELYGNVIIKYSLYHSFYYLNIKSPKLIKYIMSQSTINTPLYNSRSVQVNVDGKPIKAYDCTSTISIIDIVKDMLNPHFYTFEYIKSNSFTNILDQLFQFTHKKQILIGVNVQLDQFASNQLDYLLGIRRLDLFVKELNYIVKLFKPFIFSLPNERKDFILFLFDGLIKQQIKHWELMKYIELIFSCVHELHDIENNKSKLLSAQQSLLSSAIKNYNQLLLVYCIDNFNITTFRKTQFNYRKFHPLLLFVTENYPNIRILD